MQLEATPNKGYLLTNLPVANYGLYWPNLHRHPTISSES